jgi:hypothetical protein
MVICLAGVSPAMAASQAALTVEGTEFVLTVGDGRILRSQDLVGATLKIGTGNDQHEVTIAGVEEDSHAFGGRLLLYNFLIKDRNGQEIDFCTRDAEGRSRGFPVPDGHGSFTLTCTSGAIGKCIRWGYRLWEERSGGPPLRALHQACVHMVRADYGGNGEVNTKEGITIYVCDGFGVRPCERDAPLAFEAAWGQNGAICVARPRIPEIVSLPQLAERYPRLKPRLGPDTCTLDTAMRDPSALLFNRSPN